MTTTRLRKASRRCRARGRAPSRPRPRTGWWRILRPNQPSSPGSLSKSVSSSTATCLGTASSMYSWDTSTRRSPERPGTLVGRRHLATEPACRALIITTIGAMGRGGSRGAAPAAGTHIACGGTTGALSAAIQSAAMSGTAPLTPDGYWCADKGEQKRLKHVLEWRLFVFRQLP